MIYINSFINSIFGFFVFALIQGCGGSGETAYLENQNFNVVGVFSERVEIYNDIVKIQPLTPQQTYGLSFSESDSSHILKLLIRIKPPTVEGIELRASDVSLPPQEKYAIISYSKEGENQVGALEILQMDKNIEDLILTSSLQFPSDDINSVAHKGGVVYFTGASLSNNPSKNNAFLSKTSFNLNTGRFDAVIKNVKANGFAGNHLLYENQDVFLSTGDNGGLHVFDANTLVLKSFNSLLDLRSVISQKDGLAALSGNPATLSLFPNKVMKPVSYPIHSSGLNNSGAMARLSSDQDYLFASLGLDGFAVMCGQDGSLISTVSIPPNLAPGVERSKVIVNSVAANNGKLFVSVGEGGVLMYTYKKMDTFSPNSTKCMNLTMKLQGNVILGEGFSANGISYNGDFLTVASGRGGISVLEVGEQDNSGSNESSFCSHYPCRFDIQSSRFYSPSKWEDGKVTSEISENIYLPKEIPVTFGQSGKAGQIQNLYIFLDSDILCVYKGENINSRNKYFYELL